MYSALLVRSSLRTITSMESLGGDSAHLLPQRHSPIWFVADRISYAGDPLFSSEWWREIWIAAAAMLWGMSEVNRKS